jgi:transcriptional regulator with XRE-family HTH domain
MEQGDWASRKLPTFETGKDGFPRPGKVARYYREQTKQRDATWTQKRLAKELGITEKAVRDAENRDVGYDSMALRRKVARWFEIPPALLGLACLEEELHLGQSIKGCRKSREKTDPLRTQAGLARALGITEKAVRDMENQHKGFDSITRRRLLAYLLTIPPATLGIVTIEEILRERGEQGGYEAAATNVAIATSTGKKVTLDLAPYQDRLKTIRDRNHSSTAHDLVAQITADMLSLNVALPYVSRSDETEIRDLLCRYHQLHASILRDQGRYDAAIAELEKAAIVAERAENPRQLAVTLLRLANVFCERADFSLALAKIDAARGNGRGSNQKLMLANADYTAAISHYSRARHLEQLPPELKGVLLLGEGNAQLHLAHGNRDAILAALSLIKQGGKIIAKTKEILEEEFLIKISDRTYQNARAAALLAAGWPREALQVLTDVMDLPSEGDMTRMNAYTSYLWSQAYADLGWVDAAATPAQETLEVMKQIKSRVNIARIAGLQGQLSLLDRKNIEVIRLGVMLNGER